MATAADVQAILGNIPRLSVEELQGSAFPIRLRSGTLTLEASDVDAYLAVRSGIVADPDTSLFTPRYYEHLVDIQSTSPVSMRLFRGDEGKLIVNSGDGTLTVELSDISPLFALWQLERNQSRGFRRRLRLVTAGSNRPERGGTPFERLLFPARTVKVTATEAYPNGSSKAALRRIAESALFNISFGRGVGLSLSQSWERSYYRLANRKITEINFPQRSYNRDLVPYYVLD